MKKIGFLLLNVAIMFLVACSSGKAGETLDLGYKLEPGKTYTQKMKMEMVVTQSAGLQSSDMKTVMSYDYFFDVLDTTGGIFAMKVRFGDVEMRISSPMSGEILFSSKEGVESTKNPAMPIDMSKMFQQMKSGTFMVSMDRRGQIKDLAGVDSMMTNVLSSMNLPEELRGQMKAMFAQSFSDEKMKEQFQSMAIYPDHPVAIGDKWYALVHMNSFAEVKMNTTYTLDKADDVTATIGMESQLSMNMNNIPLTGTQTGTSVVYLNSGWIKEATAKQEISGEVLQGDVTTKLTMRNTLTISE